MAAAGKPTYVGFGFGAIQAGLLLLETHQSGAFGRMVVAEIVPEVVARLRADGGKFQVNIAHPDGVRQAEIGPVVIENPGVEEDRARLIDAIAEAQEIGTAIPSVKFFTSPAPGSLHRVLAQGLLKKSRENGPRAIVYTAENNNHAAEILEAAVMEEIPENERAAVKAKVRFLNTVVGKMSGILTDPAEIAAKGLATVTPGDQRAFLVERFNRILITKIDFPEPFTRGIAVFEEKSDLLPFEEAKLYGHNATHALAAYLAIACGVETIAELPEVPGVMPLLRQAFLEESGAALCRKYHGFDPLFTNVGYMAYADDLLERMTNPYLGDLAERVGRDPQRKLGWDDRLVGTMRLALSQGIEPNGYALGTAAGLAMMDTGFLPGEVTAEMLLAPVWGGAASDVTQKNEVLRLIETARGILKEWVEGRFPDLTLLLDGKARANR